MILKNLIWQEVQTALVALLFALLIWVYAEGENVKPQRDVPVRVQFVSPPGRPLVIEPAEVSTSLSLRVPTSQWTALREAMQKDGLSLEVDPNAADQDINLQDRLRNDPYFTRRGIEVTEAPAEHVRLHVEAQSSLTLPVEVTARDYTLAPATADPAQATVTGKTSLIARLKDHKIRAVLDNLDNLPEGAAQERDKVALSLPADLLPEAAGLRISPERVHVSFTILHRTEQYTLTAVSVYPVYAETNRYVVDINPEDRSLQNIEVEGSSNLIDRIRRGELTLTPRADLVLTSEELDRGLVAEKLPQIVNLPPGLTVRQTSVRPVRFKITRRSDLSSDLGTGGLPRPLAPAVVGNGTAAPATIPLPANPPPTAPVNGLP